jgi:hypothetical protein
VTAAPPRLTGRIRVARPPREAFGLFTPRGEQAWADGWQPRFPAPAADDTEPGTVFVTGAHGHRTVWVVTGRETGRWISYARVTPGDRAGTVTITVHPAGQHSEVEVSYQLTALSEAAGDGLRDFAEGYAGYLRSWQDAIARCLMGAGDAVRAGDAERAAGGDGPGG